MPKVLADGKTKATILTTEPADITAPTVTELEAGIDVSCEILTSDFSWTNAASETVDEKALCAKGNAQVPGTSNYDLGFTFWRNWLEAGGPDEADGDAGYQAVKEKGSTVWIYARETDKDSTEAWADADEIYLGGEVISDSPQRVDNAGYIKRRVPFFAQRMHENIAVAPAGV